MEEKIGERFLPIGTVVLLKEGKKELMIINYCIVPTGEVYEQGEKVNSKRKLYDYGACPYPEGVLGPNRILAFNHDQIDKVLHLGYETEQSKEFSKQLNDGYENAKEKIEEEINKPKPASEENNNN